MSEREQAAVSKLMREALQAAREQALQTALVAMQQVRPEMLRRAMGLPEPAVLQAEWERMQALLRAQHQAR